MSRISCCLLLALCAATPGCHIPQVQDQFIAAKNRCWAKIAWKQEASRYCTQPRPIHQTFGDGWREAYFDVAQGGSGKIPLFPPVKYWGVKYQNPLGRDQIDAWFVGYKQGAIAAKQDNVGFWMQMPMSWGWQPKRPPFAMTTPETPAEQLPAPEPGALPPPEPEILPPARQTESAPATSTIRAAIDPIRR